ncbi:hypothetical protein APY94_04040 [Thermococcus celericrescens]|uniref:Uncharacterized protein n=1 Tax=Thermococcus celericrescens TaxID=227598 RepID=A0A100XYK4_9EURY|nr:hypothetical protein [Thermococcus celericrescens]KUH33908.1 hypothetical protein APY94_04040 [Thermococcus celericrescens]
MSEVAEPTTPPQDGQKVLAKDLFKEIIEQQETVEVQEELPQDEAVAVEEKKQKKSSGKRRYISITDRTNSALMLLVLRRLKTAEEYSFQPDVKENIREAVVLLKRIIEENEDMFPGVLRSKP